MLPTRKRQSGEGVDAILEQHAVLSTKVFHGVLHAESGATFGGSPSSDRGGCALGSSIPRADIYKCHKKVVNQSPQHFVKNGLGLSQPIDLFQKNYATESSR
jgi:hypothetical protein